MVFRGAVPSRSGRPTPGARLPGKRDESGHGRLRTRIQRWLFEPQVQRVLPARRRGMEARGPRTDRRHRLDAAPVGEGRRRNSLADEKLDASVHDGRGALDVLVGWLRTNYGGAEMIGVGHRVVHGGARYDGPCIVTPEVLENLRALVPLAPLHQPHNIAAIEAVGERFPGVPRWLLRHQLPPRSLEVVDLCRCRRRSATAACSATAFTASLRVHRVGATRSRARNRRRPRDRRPPRQRREPVRDEGRTGVDSTSASRPSMGSAWARGRARSIRA